MPPCHRSHARGFTLIELMIAVAIIGILTAIAYPSYSDYVTRGKLVDATNALAATRARMEQYFQDNRSYTGGPCATSQTVKEFTVACATADLTATTYLITATGSGSTDGFVFTVNQQNTMTSRWPSRWGTAPTGNCWAVKKGTTC